MLASEVREKYLKFFEKRGHKIIPPAPLVLKDDPTTLFTSSGMQPLVSYLMGKEYPEGFKRLVDSQPSFRAQDIEEVGDNRHTTFFEMLGNWSLGDYFKKEQLPWIWEFLIEELKLPKEKLYVSIFEGNDQISEDTQSYEIWKSLGVSEDHIFKYGLNKNWWSRSGTPDEMPDGEIGGITSEVFYEFTQVTHDKKFGEKCHPQCECGRFLEIGNSVFMQYKKENGKLIELPQKNVDFGGGLERLTAATNDDPDVFKTDLFWPIIEEIEKITEKKYTEDVNKPAMRIITDHMKAATFLIANGIIPSNKSQGYILRRLLRRAAVKMHFLKGGLTPNFFSISDTVLKIYDIYLDRAKQRDLVEKVLDEEMDKFAKSLDRGLKEFEKYEMSQLNSLNAFNLYQSYGFPFEVTQELFKQKGKELNKAEFEEIMKSHQELSRKSSENKFKIK